MSAPLFRLPNWANDLAVYLDGKRGADMPCADFAAEAVIMVTGVDLRRHFQGRIKWVADHLEEAIDEVLDPRPVAFARNGDAVMKDGCVGICHGEFSFFIGLHEGETGTTVVLTLDCDKAWTVG